MEVKVEKLAEELVEKLAQVVDVVSERYEETQIQNKKKQVIPYFL